MAYDFIPQSRKEITQAAVFGAEYDSLCMTIYLKNSKEKTL